MTSKAALVKMNNSQLLELRKIVDEAIESGHNEERQELRERLYRKPFAVFDIMEAAVKTSPVYVSTFTWNATIIVRNMHMTEVMTKTGHCFSHIFFFDIGMKGIDHCFNVRTIYLVA